MRVTTISYDTPELLYRNAVCHECTCGEFLKDMEEETKRYVKKQGLVNQVDLFWHLDEYCEKKYGPCHWQTISTRSILLLAGAEPKS